MKITQSGITGVWKYFCQPQSLIRPTVMDREVGWDNHLEGRKREKSRYGYTQLRNLTFGSRLGTF